VLAASRSSGVHELDVESTLTLNSSGFSMTMVSPAGSPVAVSSNLTVTAITGCPGDSRRLRAMDG
jgi:hypothetical protein